MNSTFTSKAVRIAVVSIAVMALLLAVLAMNDSGSNSEPTGPRYLDNIELIASYTTVFTSFVYDTGDGRFEGDINATGATGSKCVGGRTVTINYQNPLASGALVPIGTATTTGNGGFTFDPGPLAPPTGTYVATVEQSSDAGDTCSAATSGPATV